VLSSDGFAVQKLCGPEIYRLLIFLDAPLVHAAHAELEARGTDRMFESSQSTSLTTIGAVRSPATRLGARARQVTVATASNRLPRTVPVPASSAEFKVLYDAHFPLVWRALIQFGVRESDLKDLTQKVFLTAYLKLPDFEGRSLVSTWLWGICRRVAIAHRRSGAMRYEVTTDPMAVENSMVPAGAVLVSEACLSRQCAAEHLLSKLSHSQRLVFTLSEVDNLDGRQIAALLDVSLGTVRSRLRYARERIRREVRRLAAANRSASQSRQ
jgi:RNA polymerase sigma-70 factor, ECF subfamily